MFLRGGVIERKSHSLFRFINIIYFINLLHILFIMSWSLFCQINLLHLGFTNLNLQPLNKWVQ